MRRDAVRATVAVAAVYGFFLIFAQFAFVGLLRAAGAGLLAEKAALGIMAAAGIAGGFFAAARGATPRMLRIALGVAAAAAALAPVTHAMAPLFLLAAATGLALGVATVGLAALLPAWCGVAWVGLGTGLGYAACNLPLVFLQSPTGQSWIGAAFALIGLLAVPAATVWPERETRVVFPWWGVVAVFTALVWLDSAAFFIIQHTADLKSATWNGTLLWRIAALHLALAAAAGLWLARGGARALPAAAWSLLAVAVLALGTPSTRALAGWFYPAGVSLYSAALVAWPGWFSGAADARSAAWRAAWLFAIAGWIGSANGIGMAQSLHHVPPALVIAAGMVVLGVMVLSDRTLRRPALAVAAVAGIAALAHGTASPPAASAMARGRRVYLAEGCIHCHSQYARPGSPDESIWGPARNPREVLRGHPVLIGNRRQGPDLTNVGARRSEVWLKVHFLNPQALAPDSTMPSYAHLFKDGRGDDLVKYLKESGVGAAPSLMAESSRWQPAGSAAGIDGKPLFATHCAACHGTTGQGNGPLAGYFAKPPADLTKGPFVWTNPGDTPLDLRVARIIKFGLPGQDMPGHETLSDAEILALTTRVLELRR